MSAHLPIEAALAILPSLPRPVLSRLVTRMIERLDEIDGDPDREEDDHGGGDVGDEGEAEEGRFIPAYGINQSLGPLPTHRH